jgi:hypothetical protein
VHHGDVSGWPTERRYPELEEQAGYFFQTGRNDRFHGLHVWQVLAQLAAYDLLFSLQGTIPFQCVQVGVERTGVQTLTMSLLPVRLYESSGVQAFPNLPR